MTFSHRPPTDEELKTFPSFLLTPRAPWIPPDQVDDDNFLRPANDAIDVACLLHTPDSICSSVQPVTLGRGGNSLFRSARNSFVKSGFILRIRLSNGSLTCNGLLLANRAAINSVLLSPALSSDVCAVRARRLDALKSLSSALAYLFLISSMNSSNVEPWFWHCMWMS
jgi:hypothetical protein